VHSGCPEIYSPLLANTYQSRLGGGSRTIGRNPHPNTTLTEIGHMPTHPEHTERSNIMESDSSSTRFTTTFAHYRYGKKCNRLKVYHRGQPERIRWEPGAKGGNTICAICDNMTGFIYLGTAICSKDDDFCYRVGRTISQSRAADQMRAEVKLAFDLRPTEDMVEWTETEIEEMSYAEANHLAAKAKATRIVFPSTIVSHEPLGA